MVTGEAGHEALEDVHAGTPAWAARPIDGELRWFLDESAVTG